MAILLRGIGYLVAALLLLVLLASAWIWVSSSRALAARSEGLAESLAPASPAQLADAERQARILGCYSCHGENLKGRKFFSEPGIGTIWASNLTEVAARATDQQLARALRQGIGVDGRPLLAMPSEVYQHLSDSEVSALIALLRRIPPQGSASPSIEIGTIGRIGLATGRFRTAPEIVADYRTREPIRVGRGHDAGHRIAIMACSGCHGASLEGRETKPDEPAPDLMIAGAYDLAAFKTLLREGRPAGGQQLKLMADVARADLSHLSDEEIEQLHAYLVDRAQKLSR